MPKFYNLLIPPGAENIAITGEDAHHIARVLRLEPNDEITICDGAGTDYLCRIDSVDDGIVYAAVLSGAKNEAEPYVKITLYPSLTKGDKLELLIQKAVELGVSRIVPVLSARCVSRPDGKSLSKKLERWNKISEQASKQCGRGIIPVVEPVLDFKAAVKAAGFDISLIAYECEKSSLRSALEAVEYTSVSLFTGPEGGYEPDEIALAAEHGIVPVSLGARILRAETAPLAAIPIILYHANSL